MGFDRRLACLLPLLACVSGCMVDIDASLLDRQPGNPDATSDATVQPGDSGTDRSDVSVPGDSSSEVPGAGGSKPDSSNETTIEAPTSDASEAYVPEAEPESSTGDEVAEAGEEPEQDAPIQDIAPDVAPTCHDGIKNGNETGVDCGGNCGPCEICFNGLDDNGDSLIDCADPKCGDYHCVPEPTLGWSGPAVSWVGSGATPSCGSPWAQSLPLHAGAVSALSANCSACLCGSSTGGACTPPTVQLFSSLCSGSPQQVFSPPFGACMPMPMAGNYGAVRCTEIPATGGSCAASGGNPTLPAPQWTQSALICSGASKGGGCSQGEVCVPKPAASMRACIWRGGQTLCALAPYTQRTIAYAGINDTRDCTSCSCGSATGATCEGEVRVYNSTTCQMTVGVLPADGSCTQFSFPGVSASFRVVSTSSPAGGTCTASGGNPQGTVVPADETTLCCIP